MARYTHDVESVELTDNECVMFARIVSHLCYIHEQHSISKSLAAVRSPLQDAAQDSAQRQARKMWRTEVRM